MPQILAIILSIVYLVSAFMAGGVATLIQVMIFLIFANLLIWFSDEMGGYAGNIPWITQQSPGSIIKVLGWTVLFSPIMIGFLVYLTQ